MLPSSDLLPVACRAADQKDCQHEQLPEYRVPRVLLLVDEISDLAHGEGVCRRP